MFWGYVSRPLAGHRVVVGVHLVALLSGHRIQPNLAKFDQSSMKFWPLPNFPLEGTYFLIIKVRGSLTRYSVPGCDGGGAK